MALSSLLPSPHSHSKQISKTTKKTKTNKNKTTNSPPSTSSWEQFKSLLSCRSMTPSHVQNPSRSLGSSCGGICTIKDVVHGSTRVVHRGEHHRDHDHDRASNSSSVGSEARLLVPRQRRAQHGSRGMHFRKLSGCYECHAISQPTRYPMPRTISSCPECGEVFTKPESLDAHQITKHGVSELSPDDSSRNIVEIIFKSSWTTTWSISSSKSPNPILMFKIDRILKVHNTPSTLARFESYRNAIRSRSPHTPRCAADGNELLRFHSLPLSCSLSSTSLCSSPSCRVCEVIKSGFGRNARTAGGSGRAHTCGEGRRRGRRGMLLCRVVAGRVGRLGKDEVGGEGGFDSVGDLEEELIVGDPKAILPCFLVVYNII